MDALTYYIEALREARAKQNTAGLKHHMTQDLADAVDGVLTAWDAEQEVFDAVEMFEVVAEGEVTITTDGGATITIDPHPGAVGPTC